jgi:hypothetical protein
MELIMAKEILQAKKSNKKWITTTIGCLFTLFGILSIGTLIVSHVFKTDGNVFLTISKLTIYLILIPAGILYIKRQAFSRWLLICTIPMLIIKPLGTIIFAGFHVVSGTFSLVVDQFYPANMLLTAHLTTHLILAILLIIHLARWNQDFLPSNEKGIYMVSKILAFFSPGLGSVSQGKLWIGFAFYFIYTALQTILTTNAISCEAGESCIEGKVLIILLQIAIWSGFNKFDSEYIDKDHKDLILSK